MPFIDVDKLNLCVSPPPLFCSRPTPSQDARANAQADRRTCYTINPRYADLSMSIKTPPPPCDDAIDPSKPILVFCHAGTSSSNSFIYQVRPPSISSSACSRARSSEPS